MNDFWRWLLGIEAAPAWVGQSDWRLTFHNLPGGVGAMVVLAIMAAVIGLVVFLYRQDGRALGMAARGALAALRLVVLLAVTFMLLELVLVLTKKEMIPSRLLVLVDTSESMGLTDPYSDVAQAKTIAASLKLQTSAGQPDLDALRKAPRFELAQRALADLLPRLAQGRELSGYGFAADLQAVDDLARLNDLTPTGPATGVGDALARALAAHRGQPLAGVLLVTEGQSNTGDDPLQVAAQAGRDGVPIVTLAVGTEQGPRNVRVADIDAHSVVFVRDTTELSAIIESRGLQGATAVVRLEQRGADGGWNETDRREIVLGEDSVLQRVAFPFTPDTLGQVDFRVRVTDAGPELTETDNLDTHTLRVIRQKIRVLLVAGEPAPEVQFLRNALQRDKGLEFASWLQSAGVGYEHPGTRPILRLPATPEELDNYDVLLMVDPDVKALGPAWPEMVTHFVGSAAGGLIYVAGELHSHEMFDAAAAEAGTGGSAWMKLLPIVRDPGLYQSSAEVQLSSREPWTLELTPQGVEDPIFQFAADAARNREILTSLPGMYWHFPVTRPKPGATVLARHGDPRMRNNFGRHVLLAAHYFGPGRTVFVGFDSTYRWRYLDEACFDGFWARLIDRVGRNKVLGGRFPFVLSADKASYRVGDTITVRAEFDHPGDVPAGLGSLAGELEVGSKAPVAVSLEPLADNAQVYQATLAAAEPGLHTLRVLPGGETEAAPRAATLTFRVEPPRRELDKPTLNRPLLDDMARASDGKVFYLADAAAVADAFQVREVQRVLEHREELWDAPLVYAGVMLLLTVEWVQRKRKRLA